MSAGMFHYISSVVVYLVWSESMPNMLEVFQGVGNDRDATKPRQVPELPPVVELACGGYHTGAISRTSLPLFYLFWNFWTFTLNLYMVVLNPNLKHSKQ